MTIDSLIAIVVNTLNDIKSKSHVCIQLKDSINSTGYLLIFTGTKNGITSIRPLKKCTNNTEFIPVNFNEISNILPGCTGINITITDDVNLQKTIYEIFFDINNKII